MRPDRERSHKAMIAIAQLQGDFTGSDLLVGAMLFITSITALNPHDAPPDIQAIDAAIADFLNIEFGMPLK